MEGKHHQTSLADTGEGRNWFWGTCEQPAGSTEGTAETWNIFQACAWMWLIQSLMRPVPDEAPILYTL